MELKEDGKNNWIKIMKKIESLQMGSEATTERNRKKKKM